MAVLSGGGGSWFKWADKPKGTMLKGAFQSFTPDVPGTFGTQDILRMDVGGGTVNVPCPAQLSSVFKKNKVAEGTEITILYRGKVSIKGGKTAHDFLVTTDEDGGGDTSFPAPAASAPKEPTPDEEAADIEAKLAAIKAKKKAA